MKLIILAALLLIASGVYFREELLRWIRSRDATVSEKQNADPVDKQDSRVEQVKQQITCEYFVQMISQKRKELQELEAAAKEFATSQATESAKLLEVIG